MDEDEKKPKDEDDYSWPMATKRDEVRKSLGMADAVAEAAAMSQIDNYPKHLRRKWFGI